MAVCPSPENPVLSGWEPSAVVTLVPIQLSPVGPLLWTKTSEVAVLPPLPITARCPSDDSATLSPASSDPDQLSGALRVQDPDL